MGYTVCSERIKSWPTKERPRERLLAEGPERMTDAELLAIILRIGSGTFNEGVPGKKAYDAAHSILRDLQEQSNICRISDHKRRCIAQIKKGIAGKIAVEPGELETLIFTRPKVGYMLNVGKEGVAILPPY